MKDMVKLLNKKGRVHLHDMAFDIIVVDFRVVYGKQQLKVTPVSGEAGADGGSWFDAASVLHLSDGVS